MGFFANAHTRISAQSLNPSYSILIDGINRSHRSLLFKASPRRRPPHQAYHVFYGCVVQNSILDHLPDIIHATGTKIALVLWETIVKIHQAILVVHVYRGLQVIG